MKQRLSGFETEEGRLKGLDFVLEATDVVITTSPKAGTTWMQQICHQLRTGGDMDFEEISEVVPWIELAHDIGQDLGAPQRAAPRCFKTHAWYPHCPKGGKYIVVVRNPPDVALSFYNFFEGWFFEPGEVEIDPFVREFWLSRGAPESRMSNASFFDHFLSWWSRRLEPDVLFLFYEDLKEDLPGSVAAVARFMGLPNAEDPALLAMAAERASFAYMKEHGGHFDEKLTKTARNAACGLRPDAGFGGTKIGALAAGAAAKALSAEVLQEIDARWARQMLPATGFASYAELRAAWHRERDASAAPSTQAP